MFQCRLLLLVTGVILWISETQTYTYPATPAYGGDAYHSYGYLPYAPTYAYPQPTAYGSGGYSTKTYANCDNMKVIEVLDQIFCAHADRKRYSSVIYPNIAKIIEELEWAQNCNFLEYDWDSVEAAIEVLENIQDAVYSNYGESSLLKPYSYDGSNSQSSSSQSAQDASTSSAGTRFVTSKKVAIAQERHTLSRERSSQVKSTKGFMTSTGVTRLSGVAKEFGTGKTRQGGTNAQAETLTVQISETLGAAESQAESAGSKLNQVTAEQKEKFDKLVAQFLAQNAAAKESKVTVFDTAANKQRRRRTTPGLNIRAHIRKARDAEYGDYTCALLPPAYCSEDKYDELLYNILDRLWTAMDLIWYAEEDYYAFVHWLGCDSDNDWWRTELFFEGTYMYAALDTILYSLWETFLYVERMYEIVELDNGSDDDYNYRAKPASGGIRMPMRPFVMAAPQARPIISQGYPLAYIPQTQAATQSPYRVTRAISQVPYTPTYILVKG